MGIGPGDGKLAAAAQEIAEADTLAFGGVGLAGTLLPATAAYQQLERALHEQPDDARQRIHWLLRHGSPAGKAYAATLLDKVDAEAGRAAWTNLRDEAGEFTTFAGCLMGHTTLREYATERLAES